MTSPESSTLTPATSRNETVTWRVNPYQEFCLSREGATCEPCTAQRRGRRSSAGSSPHGGGRGFAAGAPSTTRVQFPQPTPGSRRQRQHRSLRSPCASSNRSTCTSPASHRLLFGQGMARPSSPLPHAFHANLGVLAQPGRAILRRDHPNTHPSQRLPLRRRSPNGHKRLPRTAQRQPHPLRLDSHRRGNHRKSQTWKSSIGISALATAISPSKERFLQKLRLAHFKGISKLFYRAGYNVGEPQWREGRYGHIVDKSH